MSVAPSPRRRASLVASPTPASPSAIPRPQSASGRYRTFGLPADPHRDQHRAAHDGPHAQQEDGEKGQVRVVLRLRPSEPQDQSIPPRHRAVLVHPISHSQVRVSVDPNVLAGTAGIASTSKRHPTFTFDRVMGESASQIDMYDATAKDRVEEFLRGFNVTFLAYGQTSSGKSYSMGTTGEDADYLDVSDTSRAGLIPRTVETVFRRAEEIRLNSGQGASWECRVSFLELYNEDMIDLLANTGMPVSIREDKDGRIVWSGVREIKVSSVAEVMTLLREGSLRRQTGETNMNLTSSRSHAIFSLTLTQSRRASSLDDGDRTNTQTPNGRRPMSVMVGGSRSTTPVFARSLPPSSYSKLGRPQSVHASSHSDDMVLLTSKFNLVDLAGSERLKRTAAQGDRMKEGISINSGLLALGNVISALSEPAKARGHVPYRDSKLTRLLQDSIGGNAMTTMIACISPLEYNISETLNTINYASRARRIKNAVKQNQAEVGWDDIDHLRNTVLKLRTKIGVLETEGPRQISKATDSRDDDEAMARQIIDLTDKLADLEDEFSHLQDQYFQKCREIVALSDPDTFEDEDDKLRQFNDTIEPVVMEYEKVVTSLNGKLAELQAEVALAQQAHDEKSLDLAQTQERLGEHESYVHELQSRLAKLTERNDSSEAYIRDLETKFRSFTDNDDRQTEVITSFTQEIQQLKTDAAKSNTYIASLEARVGTAEQRSNDLGSLVERYELEAEQREQAMRDLEERLDLVDDDQNVSVLLEELETRDHKIEELQAKISAAIHPVSAGVLGAVGGAAAATAAAAAVSDKSAKVPSTPPDTPPILRTIAEDSESEVDILRKENDALLKKLRDAEHRVEQLSAPPQTPTLIPPEERDEELDDQSNDDEKSPNKRGSTGNESSESETQLQTPKLGSRAVSPQANEDSRRSPYASFRAAEFRPGSEPRLLRPLSLSQGLSSLSYGSSSPRYSWSGVNGGPSNGMLAFERSPTFGRSPKRQSMPFDTKPLRSVQSLEIDISLLQKTVADREAQLRQREVEIRYLKKSLENNSSVSSVQLNSDGVIERLRQEHADEIDKIFSTHAAEMKEVEDKHRGAVSKAEQQIVVLKEAHAVELDDLHATHNSHLDEMDTRHRGELGSSDELKSALDAAWEELSATGRRHQAERDNLTSEHEKSISELQSNHSSALESLQGELATSTAALAAVHEELAAATDAKSKAEKDLASRPDAKNMVPVDEHNIVVQAMEEMEKALTSAEDEKRQLKMKADQFRFELSKIRDEHEAQRSGELARLADLEKRYSILSAEATELKHQNQELQRNRDSKQSLLDRTIDRSSRTKLPPIGPPPTAPLPPLPAGREAVLSPTLTSSSLPRGSHHEGSTESARSSRYDHDSPERSGSAGAHTNDMDRAVSEREDALRAISEKEEALQEAKAKLETEQRNNQQFTKDLMELRKNNSKLKVRVDDVNRELSELKRERDSLRRDVVEMKNELADSHYERTADKHRLEAAKNEAREYKLKIDRMVDSKVSKRTDKTLKCF